MAHCYKLHKMEEDLRRYLHFETKDKNYSKYYRGVVNTVCLKCKEKYEDCQFCHFKLCFCANKTHYCVGKKFASILPKFLYKIGRN